MTGRIVAVCAAVLAFLLTGQESFAQAVTDAAGAAKILERTDLVLIPANASFRWSLKVERAGEPTKEDRFLGFKKGDLKYLFYTYYPIPPSASVTSASTRRSGCTSPSPTIP